MLTTEHVKELAYICTEINTADITKGHDLFLELETKGFIMPGNYDYLLDRLLQIEREDLVTYLMERTCPFPHTQWNVPQELLDRLLKARRDGVTVHFMKWICRSPNTLTYLPAYLLKHLINSGREDLVLQIVNCLYLPQEFQTNQLIIQTIYNARKHMCASHKKALLMLSRVQMSGTLKRHYQDVRQSASIHANIQWPSFSVWEGHGAINLSNTLDCVFSFADAYCTMLTTINRVENIDVDEMVTCATICQSTIDIFNAAHAVTKWNPSEREELVRFKETGKLPGAIHIQTAIDCICSVCEGFLPLEILKETKAKVSDRLFILETALYAPRWTVPMYQWMQTIIYLAASSKLDLTKHRDIIVKLATEHKEPIVQYHNELSQIIGQDVMRNIDSVLQIDKHEMTSDITSIATSVRSKFELARYMVVHWYAYLLRLLVLACDCSASPWEMASRIGERHSSFHDQIDKERFECAMGIASKIFIANHTEVENFKVELIQRCRETSTKRFLSELLPPSSAELSLCNSPSHSD